jgi:hypothetical protein
MIAEDSRASSLRLVRDWIWRQRRGLRKRRSSVAKRAKNRFRALTKTIRHATLQTRAIIGEANRRYRQNPALRRKRTLRGHPQAGKQGVTAWGYRRPAKISLAERLAELRMAMRYNWDLDIFRGRVPTPSGRSGAHRLLNPRALLWQRTPRIDVLQIPYWLRFGNSIMQLHYAFHVAEMLGARTLQFAKRHAFLEGQRAGDFELVWDSSSRLAPSLEGEFFSLKAFRLTPNVSARARVFRELIRPLLATHICQPDPRMREDDLVLYFRAGDIFARPNKRYGQPPLSYYLAAVEREQPTRVWLVFEDRGNPCIDAAEAALAEWGVKVLVQSSTLAQDLRVMLSAPKLAAGHGTFAYMIAHLSGCLHRAYFFEQGSMDALQLLGVEVIVARDADGEYKEKLLTNNWVGSKEQLRLMLSYPATKLKFTPRSSSDKGS